MLNLTLLFLLHFLRLFCWVLWLCLLNNQTQFKWCQTLHNIWGRALEKVFFLSVFFLRVLCHQLKGTQPEKYKKISLFWPNKLRLLTLIKTINLIPQKLPQSSQTPAMCKTLGLEVIQSMYFARKVELIQVIWLYGRNQSGCKKAIHVGLLLYILWVFLTIYIFVALIKITIFFKQLEASHIFSWDSWY